MLILPKPWLGTARKKEAIGLTNRWHWYWYRLGGLFRVISFTPKSLNKGAKGEMPIEI